MAATVAQDYPLATEEEYDPALEGADDDGDKTLYCFCQRVSFGEMIACDAPDCEHEWVRSFLSSCRARSRRLTPVTPEKFHLPCVGLKSIPDGRWFCDECRVSRTLVGGRESPPADHPVSIYLPTAQLEGRQEATIDTSRALAVALIRKKEERIRSTIRNVSK